MEADVTPMDSWEKKLQIQPLTQINLNQTAYVT